MPTATMPFKRAASISLAEGAVGVLDAGLLTTPYDRSGVLSGFQFGLDGLTSTYAPNSRPMAAGLLVKINIGRWEVTNGFIPVTGMCPRLGSTREAESEGITGSLRLTCFFKKPMFIPLGVQVSIQFQRNATANTDAIKRISPATSIIAYGGVFGRYFAGPVDIPRSISVPYFAGLIDSTGYGSQGRSSELQLRNKFNSDLFADYLVGYVDGTDNAAGYGNRSHDGGGTTVLINTGHNAGQKASYMDQPQPWWTVFSQKTLKANLGYWMNPNEQVDVQINKPGNDFGVSGVAIFPIIGLVGYRNEAY